MAGDTPTQRAHPTCSILGTHVDVVDMQNAVNRIITLVKNGVPAYVCAANVHMVMEAVDDADFQRIVNDAALVVADGMPLVWTQRRQGFPDAVRVRGPDLALAAVQAAARHGLPVGLYGGSPEVCERFARALESSVPDVRIAARISPPFGPVDGADHDAAAARLGASGARVVLVGLGCPKQERWMARHVSELGMVLLGVGAAFDFHAGTVRQAPGWVQNAGLEWVHRLIQEPRRLWRRYARQNTRFVIAMIRSWWTGAGAPTRHRRGDD